MAKFCTSCGSEIANGKAFCSGCGAKVVKESENISTQNIVEQSVVQPKVATITETKMQNDVTVPPVNNIHSNVDNSNTQPTGKFGVVSTGYFFGMMLLYAIPVIGWLICLITAFASKNENKKHFARAILIWLIIGAILSVSLFFLFSWLGDVVKGVIGEFSGDLNIFNGLQGLEGLENLGTSGDFGNIEGMQEIQNNGGLGDLGSILEQLKQYENMPIE